MAVRERPRTGPGDTPTVSRWSFPVAALAFTVAMMGGLLPSPLYVVYQARFHFSTGLLTVIFAVYAAGVIVALLVWGGLSDQVGRKSTLLVALAVGVASALAFLFADGVATGGVPLLLLGRFLSGLSIGFAFSTATAYLAELNPRRASRVTTAASTGGLGSGGLLCGLLVQWVPVRTVTVYLVVIALAGGAAIALRAATETVTVAARPRLLKPRWPALPGGPRRTRVAFLAGAGGGATAFATFGMFASLSPSFLSRQLHDGSHALAGAVIFAAFGAAAAVQVAVGNRDGRGLLRAGTATLPAGLASVALAIAFGQLAALVAGAVVAGVGAGLLLSGGVSVVNALSPPGRRAGIVASFYIAAYVGVGVPTIGLGVAIDQVGTLAGAVGYAVLVSAAACLVAVASRCCEQPQRPVRDAARPAIGRADGVGGRGPLAVDGDEPDREPRACPETPVREDRNEAETTRYRRVEEDRRWRTP